MKLPPGWSHQDLGRIPDSAAIRCFTIGEIFEKVTVVFRVKESVVKPIVALLLILNAVAVAVNYFVDNMQVWLVIDVVTVVVSPIAAIMLLLGKRKRTT